MYALWKFEKLSRLAIRRLQTRRAPPSARIPDSPAMHASPQRHLITNITRGWRRAWVVFKKIDRRGRVVRGAGACRRAGRARV